MAGSLSRRQGTGTAGLMRCKRCASEFLPVVAIGQGEADRLGLNYKSGRQVMMNTANGAAPGWLFKINTLRVGDVVAYEVDTVVTPAAMPAILLGNSFLNRFDMRRDGDQMMLIKR